MNITKLALANARMTWVIVILIISLGMMVYGNFPSREDPLIRINRSVIVTQFPGLPPAQVENLISKRIEEKLREVGELEFINSSSQTGQSIIYISAYENVADYDKVWDKVRRKLSDIKNQLPQGSIGPFINDDFGDVAIVTAALTGDDWDMAELRRNARQIRDQIYAIDGVRRVTLYGVQNEKAYLEATTNIIESHGIDFSAIANAIKGQNSVLPAGTLLSENRQLAIETSGKFSSISQVNEVEFATNSGEILPLKDYLTLRQSFAEPALELAFYNGKPAIIIAASMQPGRNILEVGPRLKSQLAVIDSQLPVGMHLDLATFQPDIVDSAINNVKNSLYQTLLIVLAVVILALGFKEGFIVGLTVPLIIMATLLVMFMMGIDLQFISLASLIISLGMLVDNAIVITENIHLRLGQGESRHDAAIGACKELVMPLLTSTLTTVLAFAPILLAQTTSGEFARSLSQVVSIALMISWLMSLTIVPLVASQLLKVNKAQKPFILAAGYRRVLALILSAPKRFLLLIVGFFFGSVMILSLVPVEMFSVSARSEVLIYVDLPAGYNINKTRAVSDKLNKWLLDKEQNPQVKYVTSYIGTGGPRFFLSVSPNDPAPNRGFIVVDTHSSEQALQMQQKIREFAASQLGEADVKAQLLARGTVPPGVVQLRFVGPDPQVLFSLSKQAQNGLLDIPGTIDVSNNWQNQTKRLRINIDQARVNRAGVSYESISQALQSSFTGSEITQIRRGDTLIPLIIKAKQSLDLHVSNPLDQIKIYVNGGEGDYVLLSQLATLEIVPQFGSIERRNMEKTVTVGGKHLTMKAPELQAAWDKNIQSLLDHLPQGYRVELGGELEGFENSAGTLFLTLPLFMGLILAILVAQFNSFRKTMIVGLSIPLAFSGGFFGLYLTGANFDFMGMLGFIALAGIIINNAIVLIDKITDQQRQGMVKHQAIISACSNRLRPILITTITTVLGLIPLMLMDEMLFYAMASVIIFGMAIGTIMTLGAVPAMYLLIAKETKSLNSD